VEFQIDTVNVSGAPEAPSVIVARKDQLPVPFTVPVPETVAVEPTTDITSNAVDLNVTFDSFDWKRNEPDGTVSPLLYLESRLKFVFFPAMRWRASAGVVIHPPAVTNVFGTDTPCDDDGR
jgi:hypothetical protein